MSQNILNVAADFSQALNEQVVAGDTTATLDSIADTKGVNLGNGYWGFTIDGDNQYKEYIVCTLTSTAITDIMSITPQGVATAGFGSYHRKGASVEITDWAALYRVVSVLNGTTNLYAGIPLAYDAAPALGSSNQLATVQYVLDHVNGGAVSFNAEIVAGMAGETVTTGQWVYLKVADGRWYKTDATDTTKCLGVKIGKALGAGTAGNAIAGGVFVHGLETSGTYAAFTTYYLSNTPGAVGTSAGTNSVAVGTSDANSKLIVGEVPTSHINAMVGGVTFGTPSTSNRFLTETAVSVFRKFGGTGSDGALAISSGTTTIDLSAAAYTVLNYTSIAITGTGALAFTNPATNGSIVVIKSQGNVTMTSSATPQINLSGMGASGGAGTPINSTAIATVGTAGVSITGQTTGGGAGASGTGGAAGAAGAAISPTYPTTFVYRDVVVSAGGGGGGGGGGGTSGTANSGAGGTGGRGGGALIIECGGALNMTANAISVAGSVGSAGTGSTGSRPSGGGAGGGAAGSVLVLYNTLTSGSGTITITGGAGSASGVGTGPGHGATGGGGANVTAGSAGTAGSASDDGALGGAGATGWSLVTPNVAFF